MVWSDATKIVGNPDKFQVLISDKKVKTVQTSKISAKMQRFFKISYETLTHKYTSKSAPSRLRATIRLKFFQKFHVKFFDKQLRCV